MGLSGDTGASLRDTMRALITCGVPPEEYWQYTEKDPDFDQDPPTFVYAVAQNYKVLKYFRHDPFDKNVPPERVLESVKKYLAAGIPSMFGFHGFPSYRVESVWSLGEFPFPCPDEYRVMLHAIVAAGYDDNKLIRNPLCGKETTGALLIRNSWGIEKGWGEKGYGWIPYEYVLCRLALDFWSLLSMEVVDSGRFGFAS